MAEISCAMVCDWKWIEVEISGGVFIRFEVALEPKWRGLGGF